MAFQEDAFQTSPIGQVAFQILGGILTVVRRTMFLITGSRRIPRFGKF